MSQAKKPKVIIILGPTATGKTKLAVKLAARFNGEIISADSRQVYRGLNIGTGKNLDDYSDFLLSSPRKRGSRNKKNATVIPYHLIDVLNPNQNFNVAKFKKLALKAIKDITKRGRLPIIVGGTGLYLSALIDNYDIPPIKPNKKIRLKLEHMSQKAKIELLKKMDPAALKFVDTKNPRRLDRALEVCLTGKKFSELRSVGNPLFELLLIGLTFPKDILKKRIEKRVDKMIKQGLVAETKKLLKKYGRSMATLQTIGYKEIIDYLNNVGTPARQCLGTAGGGRDLSLQKTIDLIKLHTFQFAKRQLTWFKRNQKIVWVKNTKLVNILTNNFLKN